MFKQNNPKIKTKTAQKQQKQKYKKNPKSQNIKMEKKPEDCDILHQGFLRLSQEQTLSHDRDQPGMITYITSYIIFI